MRFLIAPDSFKGTLSSLETCRVMAEGICSGCPDAQTRAVPLSDGGNGTMDAFHSIFGGQQVESCVTGPLGKPVHATYAILPDDTAVIEMAAACGMRLVEEGFNPAKATTYGVGELMLDAARRGCTTILLGLGSSCTNDGGCGAAAACGVRFLDRYVEPFVPTGSTLGALESIDASGLASELRDVEIRTICAVSNPLCGSLGTSATFAPGKGALPTVVSELDANLAHLAVIIGRDLGIDVLDMPCAGAGGGMGAGMAAFFGVTPTLGIETVLEISKFDELARPDRLRVHRPRAALTFRACTARVVAGVARHCKAAGSPRRGRGWARWTRPCSNAGRALGVTHFAPVSTSSQPLASLTKKPRSRLSRTAAHAAELICGR